MARFWNFFWWSKIANYQWKWVRPAWTIYFCLTRLKDTVGWDGQHVGQWSSKSTFGAHKILMGFLRPGIKSDMLFLSHFDKWLKLGPPATLPLIIGNVWSWSIVWQTSSSSSLQNFLWSNHLKNACCIYVILVRHPIIDTPCGKTTVYGIDDTDA